VKIDLHHQLLTWRKEIAVRGLVPWSKRFALSAASFVMRRPRLFEFAGKVGRKLLSWSPRFLLYNPLNPWGRRRELPVPPRQSFRELFRQRKSKGGPPGHGD
jgi:L-lactate dehydrogenase complex protein LldF